MFQMALMVRPKQGISRPAQAGSCLERADSPRRGGNHPLVPSLFAIREKRFPIAIGLQVAGVQREVSHE